MPVVRAARSQGIDISTKTALRWCIAGARGVRLESVKVAGRRLTSRAAMRRLIVATQRSETNRTPPRKRLLGTAVAGSRGGGSDSALRTGLGLEQHGR